MKKYIGNAYSNKKNYEFSEEYHMAIADTIDIFKQQHKEKQDE